MTLTRTFLATSSMTHVPLPCDDTQASVKAQEIVGGEGEVCTNTMLEKASLDL